MKKEVRLMKGNEAIAEAAVRAGNCGKPCRGLVLLSSQVLTNVKANPSGLASTIAWFPALYEMCRSGLQNGSFWRPKRAVSGSETGRFARPFGAYGFVGRFV